MHSSSQAIIQKYISVLLDPNLPYYSERIVLGSTHTLQTFSGIAVWLLVTSGLSKCCQEVHRLS
eukprot:13427.XXX_763286_763477_1 [CDS] Oithona nana genome sequencing.